MARVFNKFFVNIVPNLIININHEFLVNAEYLDDPIDKSTNQYNSHSSILTIKKFIKNFHSPFSFKHVSKEKILAILISE